MTEWAELESGQNLTDIRGPMRMISAYYLALFRKPDLE